MPGIILIVLIQNLDHPHNLARLVDFIIILHLRKLAQRSLIIHTFDKYLWNIHYLQELSWMLGLYLMNKESL